MKVFKAIIVAVLLLAVLASATMTYTVSEMETVIIVRLGKFSRTIASPGLHFKLPFIEEKVVFERWLLDYDSRPREIITKDKKNLVVDNYAKWRIIDPLLVYQTVRNVAGAQSRLDDIIYSELRQSLGNYTFEEIVKEHRSEIMTAVTRRSNLQARDYGIEILDVRIKRADLPRENEQAIFARMREERVREAKRYRSEGAEKARKIRALADKSKQIILARARQEAEELRGRADALATQVFARAYEHDVDFFRFYRTLAVYKAGLTQGTTLVMTPEMEIFGLFKESGALEIQEQTTASSPATQDQALEKFLQGEVDEKVLEKLLGLRHEEGEPDSAASGGTDPAKGQQSALPAAEPAPGPAASESAGDREENRPKAAPGSASGESETSEATPTDGPPRTSGPGEGQR